MADVIILYFTLYLNEPKEKKACKCNATVRDKKDSNKGLFWR